MIVVGIDLGNKSRNGISVIDSNQEKLLDYSYLSYTDSPNPYTHRKKIVDRIREYINNYKVDVIIFEKVNLYVGRHISKLNNIMSLAFIQATLINEFSEDCEIIEVNVMSWKSRVLGSSRADKNDAINFVRKYYPDVNLEILVEHKRKDNEIIINHDLADSICIGIAGCRMYSELKIKGKVNYN